MRVVPFTDIVRLKVDPRDCVAWARNCFLVKDECDLPPKISQKLPGDIFVNTMPCMIPQLGLGGVKVVSRYPLREPALDSVILIYDLKSGEFLAMMDANWITAMRTGAVAALAVLNLAKPDYSSIGMIGLGNTARATIACLAPMSQKRLRVKLLRYKDQAELFMERFKDQDNITFEVVDTPEQAIRHSDVVISCLTAAGELLGEDDWFSEGVLVVPVHTRGFQNCDLFFDRVFADDTDHVRCFKHFDSFRYFNEIGKVLQGQDRGRHTNAERILSYNIGISLHDVYFAGKILSLLDRDGGGHTGLDLAAPTAKFWV